MTKAAAGLQKKSAAPTTSSGSATRPSGMRASSVPARRRVGEPVRAHLAAHDGRRDAVDGDAVRRELDRVLLDQHHQRALGRAVGRVAAVAHAELRAHREQVHLAARRARPRRRDLVPRGGLARNIAAFRLTCTTSSKAASRDLGEALLALDADAVDEQVEAAEARGDGVDGGADAVDRVRVHGEADRVVAGGAQRCRERLGLGGAAPGDGDARAGERQRPRRSPRRCRRSRRATNAARPCRLELAGEQAGVVGRGAGRCRPSSQSISRPPLRSMISPVMKPDSGEARKRTTWRELLGLAEAADRDLRQQRLALRLVQLLGDHRRLHVGRRDRVGGDADARRARARARR